MPSLVKSPRLANLNMVRLLAVQRHRSQSEWTLENSAVFHIDSDFGPLRLCGERAAFFNATRPEAPSSHLQFLDADSAFWK
jgi:hypothetical protein